MTHMGSVRHMVFLRADGAWLVSPFPEPSTLPQGGTLKKLEQPAHTEWVAPHLGLSLTAVQAIQTRNYNISQGTYPNLKFASYETKTKQI